MGASVLGQAEPAEEVRLDPEPGWTRRTPDLGLEDDFLTGAQVARQGEPGAPRQQILAVREGAFSDVEIKFDSLDIFGSRGLAEFRVSATFSGPFVIDETTAIEPNGKQLLLGIAAVADFDGDKINALRAYFDDASLLEQMLET